MNLQDNLYFDICVTSEVNTQQVPQIFSFDMTRNTPYLYSPEKYKMSVIRFSADSSTLPLFIPQIRLGVGQTAIPSLTINDTSYSLTLQYKNYVTGALSPNNTQVFIEWTPQDLAAQIPALPINTSNGLQDNSTGYYNCYSYNFFINLVNVALTKAFNNLNTIVVAGGDVLPSINAPFMSWDSSSNSAIIYFDNAGYNQNSADPICLYFNAALFNIFNSFPFELLGYGSPFKTLGKEFKILCSNSNSISLSPVSPPAPAAAWQAIQVFQENSTIAQWSPITSIVWTSLKIPIVATNTTPTQIYINNQLISQSSQNNNSSLIITDIIANDFQYRGYLLYNPTAEYRYVSLLGNQPLYNLDIQIFYRLKDGSLQPFRIASGGSVTLKLYFKLI